LTQSSYGYVRSGRSFARPAGRSVKGSYSSAKGSAKSYRVSAPAGLKRVIRAVIAQQKEQKLDVTQMYSGALTNLTATDGDSTTVGAAPSFEPLAPFVLLGPSDGQRIASDIKIVKSYVKLQICLNQEASSTNGPFIVTVWIGRVRALGAAVPNAADFSSLLMTPASNVFSSLDTTNPVTGLYPVNDDLWDIKVRKDYKLGKADTSNASNNDFNLCYNDEIDITRMFPSTLRYNGSSGVVQEDNLFFFATYRSVNGALFTAGLPKIAATAVHRYTDA